MSSDGHQLEQERVRLFLFMCTLSVACVFPHEDGQAEGQGPEGPCDPCPGFKTWLDKALHNQV